jgi:hypothetical protein
MMTQPADLRLFWLDLDAGLLPLHPSSRAMASGACRRLVAIGAVSMRIPRCLRDLYRQGANPRIAARRRRSASLLSKWPANAKPTELQFQWPVSSVVGIVFVYGSGAIGLNVDVASGSSVRCRKPLIGLFSARLSCCRALFP